LHGKLGILWQQIGLLLTVDLLRDRGDLALHLVLPPQEAHVHRSYLMLVVDSVAFS
jgi:hypothetical protein